FPLPASQTLTSALWQVAVCAGLLAPVCKLRLSRLTCFMRQARRGEVRHLQYQVDFLTFLENTSRMNYKEETIWLAAMFEGEGTFCLQGVHKERRVNNSIRAQFGSTDQDVTEKVAKIMGTECKEVTSPSHKMRGDKQMYYTYATGDNAVQIMKRILPYMGKRRTEKINEMLEIAAQRVPRV